MFKSKAKDEYIRTVEHCISNQDYIIETATLFIEILGEERNIFIEEGKRIKNKSNYFIELIGDDSSSSTDFASSSKIFAKFFEIVGHLVSQNCKSTEDQTDYQPLIDLVEDLKDFNKEEVNKSVIVEKLKTLNKMRNTLSKKEDTYQRCMNNAEEAFGKFKEIRQDPNLDYELSIKETAKEKAENCLKSLEDKKCEFQSYINQVNEHQKGCIEDMDHLMSKTKSAILKYISELMSICFADAKQLGMHFEGITLLTDEKGKQFNNIQKLKYFESKKNLPIIKLRDLRHSLDSKEANSLKKLRIYKDAIFNIVSVEKEELEQNHYIIHSLLKYISVLQEVKEKSNKRFTKLVKLIKSRIHSYTDDFPLLELWKFMIKKYEATINNNSLYIVFFDNIKTKIESLVTQYTTNSKGPYKDIQSIYDELHPQEESVDSEDHRYEAEGEVSAETESLINAIDLVSMSVQDTFSHIEVFITSLYSCLSALVSYEGTYIQQCGELIKNQHEFLDRFDVKLAESKKIAELKDFNQLTPEIFEEFDLIPKYDLKEEDVNSNEGHHLKPYVTKEPSVTLSENQSCRSVNSAQGSNDAKKVVGELNFEPKEESKEPVTPTKVKPSLEPYESEEKQKNKPGRLTFEDLDRKSSLFQLVKFSELKSSLIDSEMEHFEDTEDAKGKDPGASSFEKKFSPERGEKLLDSFTCAIAKKILLHGRLYITNQRLCFYSMFNNKLLFFGKETKLTIPLNDIKGLEKRINALVFDNSIAVITKNSNEYFFTSFLKRDKAFDIVREILEKGDKPNKNTQNASLLKRTYIRLQSEGVKDDMEEEEEEDEEEDQGNFYEGDGMGSLGESINLQNHEDSNHQDHEVGNQPVAKLDLKSNEQRKLFEELCATLDEDIAGINDELDPSCHKDYDLSNEFTIENMSIQCFYNRIFGPQKTEDDMFFHQKFLVDSENFNFEIKESFEQLPPAYFTDETKIVEDYSLEELKEIFSEPHSTKFSISYTHPLKQTFGPKQCDITETLTHYFISPTKVIVRGFVQNFGFTFCDCFNPMSIHIIEQKYDKKKNKLNISVQTFSRVNFIKSVMFFQNKIKTEAKKETENVYQTIYTPLVEQYLKQFQQRYVRAVSKQKKKLSKMAKLKLELEDLQLDHEDKLAQVFKEHDKVVSSLGEEITQAKEDYATLELKAKAMAAILVALVVMVVCRLIYGILY